jgi:hypothetical protein
MLRSVLLAGFGERRFYFTYSLDFKLPPILQAVLPLPWSCQHMAML